MTITANHFFLAVHLYSLDFSFALYKEGLYGRGWGREVNKGDPLDSSKLPNVVYLWGICCPI